jgi:hypothetical protein
MNIKQFSNINKKLEGNKVVNSVNNDIKTFEKFADSYDSNYYIENTQKHESNNKGLEKQSSKSLIFYLNNEEINEPFETIKTEEKNVLKQSTQNPKNSSKQKTVLFNHITNNESNFNIDKTQSNQNFY